MLSEAHWCSLTAVGKVYLKSWKIISYLPGIRLGLSRQKNTAIFNYIMEKNIYKMEL
jgi:hypothetical protein